jgi:crotonobetainyl-CoA:carnitine CoA-transferase CaiB-like acyl-CoA transferase
MKLIGRDDLATLDRYRTNPGRATEAARIDAAIGDWTSRHPLAECLAALEAAQVPAGPIYSMADIAQDPQYAARDMLVERQLDDGTTITMPGIVPRMTEAPGGIDRLGQVPLGADNDDVYGGLLGIDDQERARLRAEGII